MPYMQRVTGTAPSAEDGVIEATYQIHERPESPTVGGLSAMFAWLNYLKTGGGQNSTVPMAEPLIIDFGVTRSGLEQVFIQFAKHQIHARN